jgi:hypothetical protein
VNAVMNFGLHKMRGICWLAEKLLASQESLCPMELVSFRGSRNGVRSFTLHEMPVLFFCAEYLLFYVLPQSLLCWAQYSFMRDNIQFCLVTKQGSSISFIHHYTEQVQSVFIPHLLLWMWCILTSQ